MSDATESGAVSPEAEVELAADIWAACRDDMDRVPQKTELDPAFRFGTNMWLFSDDGQVGLPRFGVEVLAGQWHYAGLQANVAVPGRFVLNGAVAVDSFATSQGPDGVGRVDAGPLRFERHEPLRRWMATWSGLMRMSDATSQRRGLPHERDADVSFAVDTEMAAPPWFQAPAQVGAAGGGRLTQFFRSTGSIVIDGERLSLDGTGLRVHRTGLRAGGTFDGHVWQGALFPSGAAFEILVYRARPDGPPKFAGGFVLREGARTPVEVREVRWLSSGTGLRDDVSLVLRVDGRDLHISGTVHGESYSPAGGSLFPGWSVNGRPIVNRTEFQQAMVRYEWDGETAYGLLERSYLPTSAESVKGR